MKYNRLFLVLMLLVASLAPVQGVYADTGSGSNESGSDDNSGDDNESSDDSEETDTDENETDDESDYRHRVEYKDGEFKEEIRDGNLRYRREFKDGMMREELQRKGSGPSHIFKQEFMLAAPPMEFKHVDPLHLIIGAMFRQADDLQPKDFVQYCDNPEQMVDMAIEKLKEKGVWNDRAVCDTIYEEAVSCGQREDRCDKMLEHTPFGGRPLEGLTCETLSEDAVFEACVAKQKEHVADAEEKIEQFREEARDRCEKQWDLQKEALRCGEENTTNAEMCDKDAFIDRCAGKFDGAKNDVAARAEEGCRQQASSMYNGLKHACDQRTKQYNHCKEITAKHCSVFEDAAAKCKAVTEEELRAAMIKDAERMCKFAHYETGKERIELRGQDVSALVKELQALRAKAGLSEQVVLDENTDSVVDVAQTVDEVENRGIGRKLKWFVGAAAKAEKEDAVLLKGQAERLDATIASLEAVAASLTDETTKAAIEAQIEVLKAQKEDIKELAAKKQKRAKGMFSFLFGGETSEETETDAQANESAETQ